MNLSKVFQIEEIQLATHTLSEALSLITHYENRASTFSDELQTIFTCLSCLSHRLSRPFTKLLTDSLSSILAMQDTYSDNPIHILLSSLTAPSITVSFLWIPSHIGLPKHHAVDIPAEEPLLSPTITDSPLAHARNLKIYDR